MADKILILDVSHWQGVMNWEQAVKMGCKGAFLKATEGTNWLDPQFHRNWQECERLGIPWGAYHYFLPAYSTVGQIDNFSKAVMGLDPPLGMDGDLEQSTSSALVGSVADKAIDFMEGIDPVTFQTWAYSSPWYVDYYLKSRIELKSYRLHLANYAAVPYIPEPWRTYFGLATTQDVEKTWVWQFTSAGHGYGEGGSAIDLNYAMVGNGFATEAQWNVLSGGVIPSIPVVALFKAVCIKPEGVDTRDQNGIDIKQDLHFGDIVNVYAEQGSMYKIESTYERWVTNSTNYMLKMLPPVVEHNPLCDGVKALFDQYRATL